MGPQPPLRTSLRAEEPSWPFISLQRRPATTYGAAGEFLAAAGFLGLAARNISIEYNPQYVLLSGTLAKPLPDV